MIETLADRVFARLIAIYGAQKVGSMWSGANHDEVLATWDEGLAEFHVEAIDQALRSLMRSFRTTEHDWPPDWREFARLVDPFDREIRRRAADRVLLAKPARVPSPAERAAHRRRYIEARRWAEAFIADGGVAGEQPINRLLRAVAGAAELAGGDGAATLRRIEVTHEHGDIAR